MTAKPNVLNVRLSYFTVHVHPFTYPTTYPLSPSLFNVSSHTVDSKALDASQTSKWEYKCYQPMESSLGLIQLHGHVHYQR